jgi:hypothetical protein
MLTEPRRTFLMFCIFNWALVFYAFFFVKETAKKSLEEMDALFAAKGTNPDTVALEDVKRDQEVHIESKSA